MPALAQHCPQPRELDDLELLLGGVLTSRDSYLPPVGRSGDHDALALELPADVADTLHRDGALELVDPEGLPLARLATDGSLTALSAPEYGPFRRFYRSPDDVRGTGPDRVVVPVDDALGEAQVSALAADGRPLLLLALAGTGRSPLSAPALLRATLAAAAALPDAEVAAVSLAAHPQAPSADDRLRAEVVAAYAGRAGTLEPGPASPLGDEVARIVAADLPAPGRQGLVVFFTGLSGSGKSTIARALIDRVLESGERSVTSLDGDVVRRHLSAGLGFSREDRETNIRRIGWVAAEIGRHGGLAVCSPIAPFAETRAQVRAMAEAVGAAFVLVHVATPLAECERRDRKGLYARARRGEIPDFTGISSPYEEPTDAAVRVDTTGRSIPDALDEVWTTLRRLGHLDAEDQT